MSVLNSIQSPVITHLYGHGTADSTNFGYFKYAIPYYENTRWNDLHNLSLPQEKIQSLVIFNTCFSGATNYLLNYDTQLYPSLLHQGAPAVVISNTQSEDQSSALIFSAFYDNLEKGFNTEDAFYLAKKNYLENQKGVNCNPLIWNAYRMISQQKIVPFTPLNWWEKVLLFLSNVQYLFSQPAVV
jgi:hypothetical protein